MGQYTVYKSGDSGSPGGLTGQTGNLITVLDAVLVNGWTASVTSITRSGSTVTVTTATAHGFQTGLQTTIAGANETDYNGTFTITVTGATTFTYTIGTTPATPATGTITWKKLGAGWTKAFSGSSKAVYQQGAANLFYMRIQDDGPGVGTFKEARIVGYESMTTIDVGLTPFPTIVQAANGQFIRKSASADATARTWIIYADNKSILMFILTGDNVNVYQGFIFGDAYSFVGSSDAYRTVLIANATENSANSANGIWGTNASLAAIFGHYIARGYLGTGTAVNIGKHVDPTPNGASAFIGAGGASAITYPNGPDGGFYMSPIWLDDITTGGFKTIRGILRGAWGSNHNASVLTDQDTFTGTGDLAGKTFVIVKFVGNNTGSGAWVIEISNTLPTN